MAGVGAKVAVLAVGAVVCISAAVAGDTSQDLKTGFLLGATPRRMQLGEMMGVLASAAVMGGVLVVLNESYGIGTVDGLPAPQATLMSLVIDGVLNASLPWGFVIVGMAIAAIVEFGLKLPSLAFAVGVYLPVSLMTPIFVGGLMRRALAKKYEHAGTTEDGTSILAERREQGVLYASGLIAGAAFVGVLIGGAIYTVSQMTGSPEAASRWIVGHGWMDGLFPFSSSIAGSIVFAGLCWLLWRGRHAGEPRLIAPRRGRAGALLTLLVGLACQGESSPTQTISRDQFIDTYVALRVEGLRSEQQVISPEARARVLDAHGLTEGELLEFAETMGGDVDFMRDVWNEIEQRLEDLRTEPDSSENRS